MGGTINSGGIYGFGVDLDKLSMTTATDPATNAATTSTIIGSFAGIIITTTTTGNSQTLSDPTDTTAGKVFSVVVDEDSTNSVPVVANATTYTIAVGTSQSFIWNGAEWGAYDMGITSLPVPYNQGGTGVTNDLANYYIWVDGSRSDTYTADGSMARPYKTVLAALTAINADTGKSWVMNVASGTYSDNLTITSPRYLRIAAQGGVVLSGTILINSGVGSYDRIEFVGGVEGCRAEKGAGLTISGKMTCTRTNDSLIYVSFSGCYITGELECTTNGTWVLQYKGCRVEGNIKGTFDGVTADQTILIETFGFNEFATGTISGKTSFYNCHDSDFYGTINTTPWYESRFHHCTFGGSVSIIPQVGASSALIYFDSNSYKSMAARTPTLTGVTVSGIDNILAAGTNVFIGDTSNSKSTQGLTINQGANDDEIISLKSSDVNHSFTDRTEADTYGVVSKTSATLGGLAIYGYSDGDYNALYLAGNMGTTDPTDINGAIEFEGNKLSGTTIGALGAAETVLNVKNRATTLFSVLGDGKTNFWKTANDGTNYEGLQIDPATAGNMQIIAKTAGTGTDNIDITLTPAGTGAIKTTGNLDIGSSTAGKNVNVYATHTPIFTFDEANINEDDATWTMTGTGPLVHVTGNATTVTLTTTEAIEVGRTYKVTMAGTGGGATATYTLGGVTGTTIAASGTIAISDYITASTTGALIITPSSTCTVSITSITIEKLPDATGDLTVEGNILPQSQILATNKGGEVNYPAYAFYNQSSTGMGAYAAGSALYFSVNGARVGRFYSSGFEISTGALSIGTSSDCLLYRDAAATLAQRNSTTQQIYRLYNTYTDSSNYERLTLTGVQGASVNLTAETAGTGGDNLDVVITPAGTGQLKNAASVITSGSGTGVTVNHTGAVIQQVYKVTTTYAAYSDSDLTKGIVIATLPAKTRLVACYADTTVAYAGTDITAATLEVGVTAEGAAEIIAVHDVFAGAVTKGLADADMGTGMTRAAQIQGAYTPSFTGTTAVYATIDATTGAATTLADLTAGSTTFYLITEKLP